MVLDHAGVPFLRGGYVGVDVFFVLSGFLITSLLLHHAESAGYVSLSDFYVRRARRILPAAALTLVVTDVAAYHLLNVVRAREAVSDSIWASLFAANVRFGQRGTDYFAQGQPPSPIQHFWSLSIEEQFYFVWPALISLVLFGVLFGRRRRRRPDGAFNRRTRGRLLVVLLIALTASLIWSIHETEVSRPAAYFSSFARAWELALGAALAIAAGGISRIPSPVRVGAGWIGLAAIAAAAVTFSGETRFPGYVALLPTVGAALVIAAGVVHERERLGAGRVLGVAPLRYVGDRSYTLYLWHWPILVIAVGYAGHDLSVATKLLLVAGAFLLSIVTYAAYERPLRRMRPPLALGTSLWPASAAVVAVVAVLTLNSIDAKSADLNSGSQQARIAALAAQARAPIANRGADSTTKALPIVVAAVAAAQRGDDLPANIIPPLDKLLNDGYAFPPGCTPGQGETSSKICRLGARRGAKTLLLMGDSFAQMLMTPVLAMSSRDKWAIRPIVKNGCNPFTWPAFPQEPECPAWYKWALRQAKRLRPDVTLVSGEWGIGPGAKPDVDRLVAFATAMKPYSSSVIVSDGPPRLTKEPVDCLLARDATMKTCSEVLTPDLAWAHNYARTLTRKRGLGFIDMQGWFCYHSLCPYVIDRIVTHRDTGHMSKTYGLRIATEFRSAFRRELFR